MTRDDVRVNINNESVTNCNKHKDKSILIMDSDYVLYDLEIEANIGQKLVINSYGESNFRDKLRERMILEVVDLEFSLDDATVYYKAISPITGEACALDTSEFTLLDYDNSEFIRVNYLELKIKKKESYLE